MHVFKLSTVIEHMDKAIQSQHQMLQQQKGHSQVTRETLHRDSRIVQLQSVSLEVFR